MALRLSSEYKLEHFIQVGNEVYFDSLSNVFRNFFPIPLIGLG